MWQHVNLSEQIRPWDTLACCWDVKQPTNKQTSVVIFCMSLHTVVLISRVPNQNGVSQAWYIVEIHHSGREPSDFVLFVFFCCFFFVVLLFIALTSFLVWFVWVFFSGDLIYNQFGFVVHVFFVVVVVCLFVWIVVLIDAKKMACLIYQFHEVCRYGCNGMHHVSACSPPHWGWGEGV